MVDTKSDNDFLDSSFNKLKASTTGLPNVLCISPTDPTSGAGLLQDVRTIETSQMAYPLGVVSGITYQTANTFYGIDWLPFETIAKQIETLWLEHHFQVVKIGLIPNLEFLNTIVQYLFSVNLDIKIIWDPILKTSSGFDLNHQAKKIKDLNQLISKIYFITPNQSEFNQLKSIMGIEYDKDILKLTNWAITGGINKITHQNEKLISEDKVYTSEGNFTLTKEIYPFQDKHGSGCVFSTLLAVQIVNNVPLAEILKNIDSVSSPFFKSTLNGLGVHFNFKNKFELDGLYFITPDIYNYNKIEDYFILLKSVIDGGCRLIQIRQKNSNNLDYLSLLKEIKSLCPQEVNFIVNDYPDLAYKAQYSGVHVGLQDEHPLEIKKIYGNGMIVGKTIHSVLELEELNLLGNEIDYFGIGPLNSTSTKNDAPRPLGWAGINTIVLKAKALYPSIPIAIIGGITLDDLDEFCVQSKILEGLNYIDSFAVSGDIAKSVNPKEKVEKFIIKIKQINDLKNKR